MLQKYLSTFQTAFRPSSLGRHCNFRKLYHSKIVGKEENVARCSARRAEVGASRRRGGDRGKVEILCVIDWLTDQPCKEVEEEQPALSSERTQYGTQRTQLDDHEQEQEEDEAQRYVWWIWDMVALFWCLFLEFEAGRTKSSRKKAVEEKRFRHNLYSRHSPYRFEATNKNPNTGNDGRNTQERNSNEQLWNINEYSNRPTDRPRDRTNCLKVLLTENYRMRPDYESYKCNNNNSTK